MQVILMGFRYIQLFFTIGTVMSKICIMIVRKAKFSCSKPHVVNFFFFFFKFKQDLSSVLRTVFNVI